VANDATVKGGAYYPITVKKHLRAQVRGAPCSACAEMRTRLPSERQRVRGRATFCAGERTRTAGSFR